MQKTSKYAIIWNVKFRFLNPVILKRISMLPSNQYNFRLICIFMNSQAQVIIVLVILTNCTWNVCVCCILV